MVLKYLIDYYKPWQRHSETRRLQESYHNSSRASIMIGRVKRVRNCRSSTTCASDVPIV